jgi:hypothetical protein
MSYTRSLRNEDYIRKLADYLKKNTAKGYPLDTLRWALIKQGHTRTCVDKAIEIATNEMAAAPKVEVKEEKKVEILDELKPVKKGFFARLFRR